MKTTKKKIKSDVHNFVSEKRLKKIKKILNARDGKIKTIEKIKNLMSDEFYDDGIGTNRLVFRHNSKYKDLVFKIATDFHGIEANYREFYNGDLDDSLVYSYSISDDGTFLVQEAIDTTLTSELRDKYKKKILKLLKHLSKKLLLVDLNLRTFRNFGLRSNGELVVLDHGDTVPLRDYQGGVEKSVNADEEFFVSLRCKVMDFKKGKKNPKPCGGHLHYSKDYSTLICDKCGNECLANEAYKQFYPDKIREEKEGLANSDIYLPDYDPVEFERQCIENAKKYSQEKMKNKQEEETMFGKGDTINLNGHEYGEHKGVLYPIMDTADYNDFVSVRKHKMKPKLFFKQRGLDISEYDKLKVINNASAETYVSNQEEVSENITSNKEFVLKIENIISRALDAINNSKATDLTKSPYGDDMLKIDGIGADIRDLSDKFDMSRNDICKFMTTNIGGRQPNTVFRMWCHGDALCVNLHKKYLGELNKKGSNKPMSNDIRVVFEDEDLTADQRTMVNQKECIEYRGYYVPVELIEEHDMVLKIPKGDVRAFLDSEGYDGYRYNVKSNQRMAEDLDDEDDEDDDDDYDFDENAYTSVHFSDGTVISGVPDERTHASSHESNRFLDYMIYNEEIDAPHVFADKSPCKIMMSADDIETVFDVETATIPVIGTVITDKGIDRLKQFEDVADVKVVYEDNKCVCWITLIDDYTIRRNLKIAGLISNDPISIYTDKNDVVNSAEVVEKFNTNPDVKGLFTEWYMLLFDTDSPLYEDLSKTRGLLEDNFFKNGTTYDQATKYLETDFKDEFEDSLIQAMDDGIITLDNLDDINEYLNKHDDDEDAVDTFIEYCESYINDDEEDEEDDDNNYRGDPALDDDLLDAYNEGIDDTVNEPHEEHQCKCGGKCKHGEVDLGDMPLTEEQKSQLSEVINNAITSALKIFMTVGAEKIQQVSEYIEQENAIKRGEAVKGAIPVQYETVKNKNIAVEKDGKFYHVDIDKIVHSMIHDDVDSKTHNVLSKFVSIK